MHRSKIVLLFVARSLGLFMLSRFLTRSRVRILCYHAGCIGDERNYNAKLFCSVETFRSRMQWLTRRGFNVVSLDKVVDPRGIGDRPDSLRTVITFDDGWASTSRALIPVLSEMKIPSTLYLCSKHFLEQWPILNVAVRYAIWKSGATSVQIEGFHQGVDGHYDLSSPAKRNQLAAQVVDVIESNANGRAGVCEALNRFGACLGVEAEELDLNSGRFEYMSEPELLSLPSRGCAVELHGHVHHYPKGEPLKFKEDLTQCRDTIVRLGLPKPQHYCYPSGSFDRAASEVLSELDIKSATTCIPGLVVQGGTGVRHYLPRFLDGEDVHALEFEAELSGFSEIARRFLPARSLTPYAG